MSTTSEDFRITAIDNWLKNELQLQVDGITTASSDASFRRYFRVTYQNRQQIVMDAPPQRENIESFIQVAELLKKSGLRVPKIYRQNRDQGFLLLEDFGSQCFLDQLTPNNADKLYQTALDSLFLIQNNTNILTCTLPDYDYALLNRELVLFSEWYLQKYLSLALTEQHQTILADSAEILISSALQQPKVCVHRDYHSRNLMLMANESLGVLDFQDAVIGPVTYDLVSLLRDCYIAWSEDQVNTWMTNYYRQLLRAKLVSCGQHQFKRWFDLMGLQRHLKAIGIFARLQIRDGKTNYIQDIPRTMHYVMTVSSQYHELSAFHHFLREQVSQADPALS